MEYKTWNMECGQAPRHSSLDHARDKSGQALRPGSGQAAISLIFLVGGTILLVGVTLAFLIFSFISSTFGFQAANRALGVAMGGVNDTLFQISRNKNFVPPSVTIGCGKYAVDVDGYSAEITVYRSWGYPSDCGGSNLPPKGLIYIFSEAAVFGRGRKVRVVASVSPEGRVGIVSIKQEVFFLGGAGSSDD